MKRLLDTAHDRDPELTQLARMLEHVAPISDEVGRRRRVRLALHIRVGMPWRWGRGSLALVLSLVAGVAGAAGRQLLRSPSVGSTASIDGTASAQLATDARGAPVRPASLGAGAPASVAVEVASAVASAAARPAAASASRMSPQPVAVSPNIVPHRATRRLAATAPTGDDPGTRLMVEAMQARAAGKYGRALELLAEYQRRFAGGGLQDEALALSVEMTSLQGAAERARSLARAYLARFPHGRYRAWVSQSLDAPEP